MKLRLTKRAAQNIDDIVDYIAQRSPQSAGNVRDRLRELATLLTHQPNIGRKTTRKGTLRVVAHPYPYVIFYRITADAVVIQRIRHTSRRPSGAPGPA